MHAFGFPLPAFAESGFVTIRTVLWSGLAFDLVMMFAFSAVVYWLWERLSRKLTQGRA